MILANQVPSADFLESLRLLKELHFLSLAGKDQDEESDVVREAMEGRWWRLTNDERRRLEGLSADLYSIGESRELSSTIPAETERAFEAATTSGNWDEALAILRQHQSGLPAHEVATMRGVAWGTFGQYDIASLFFAEASRLRPDDIHVKWLWLRALIHSGQLTDARDVAAQLAQTAASPLELLLAADVLFDASGQEPKVNVHQQVADIAWRASRSLKPASIAEESSRIAGLGLLSGAISFELIGKHEEARNLLGMAATLLPNAAALGNLWPPTSSKLASELVTTLVRVRQDFHADELLLVS